MSALPVTVTATLEPVSCFSCGTWFGVDSRLRAEFLRDHRDFWCPNGHSQHYVGKTEAQLLKEQLEQQTRYKQWANERAERAEKQRDHEKARAAVYRGHLTRVRKRVGNGVCPCCNRTFENLQKHMTTQHPAYGAPPKKHASRRD